MDADPQETLHRLDAEFAHVPDPVIARIDRRLRALLDPTEQADITARCRTALAAWLKANTHLLSTIGTRELVDGLFDALRNALPEDTAPEVQSLLFEWLARLVEIKANLADPRSGPLHQPD